MKIAFIPIDNRPVCYQLPEMLSKIDDDIEFYIPDRRFLGGLQIKSDIAGLYEWLMTLPEVDSIVLSLDTVAYGGLIPSRRCMDSYETIKSRLETLKEIFQDKHAKIYAFSSIMRISDNNFNEEEKKYWSEWGKKIFEYSYNIHKNGSAKTDVPSEILRDYLETRRRNFEINKMYLKWQKEGLFDTLIFSKDDCAKYGFNVQEGEVLSQMGGIVKTGADEIPLSLLARAINGKIKICPVFTEPEYKDLISNYEDISIEKTVISQIELSGCELSDENSADMILYVNNFKKCQGEIVMKIDTQMFDGDFKVPDKPYMIADVRFANGSDNNFVNALFKNKIVDEYFYGYSAWNTSANSLGSLICGAKIKFLAKKYNEKNFKNLQTVRFLDDWGYQANVRQSLKSPDTKQVSAGMKQYENEIQKFLDTKVNANYSFPWNRLFEVEIGLN